MTVSELNKKLKAEFDRRVKLIDSQQARLIELIGRTEDHLFNMIIENLIDELVAKDGRLEFQGDAISFSRALDRIYDRFINNVNIKVINQIADDFSKMFTMTGNYYGIIAVSPQRFKAARDNVREAIMERIGIRGGKIVSGGYLDALFRSVEVRERIKQQTYKAVLSQKPFKDYIKILRTTIKGADDVDGVLTKYYKQYAYDTYQQFDRISNHEFAKELDLQCFIYEGGLIETSRKFCIKHNGKVFTVEEAENWKSDPDLPRTKEERETGVLMYNPTEDLGRFNCRHMTRYISNELAVMLRPDLKRRLAA